MRAENLAAINQGQEQAVELWELRITLDGHSRTILNP